jgi:hypothetical protein
MAGADDAGLEQGLATRAMGIPVVIGCAASSAHKIRNAKPLRSEKLTFMTAFAPHRSPADAELRGILTASCL